MRISRSSWHMRTDSGRTALRRHSGLSRALLVSTFALVSTGCALLSGATPEQPASPRPEVTPRAAPTQAPTLVCVDAQVCAQDTERALIALHGMLWTRSSEEVRLAQQALDTVPPETLSPPEQMRQAILLGHPRASPDFARARSLLAATLATSSDEARALHPLASLLSNEWQSREQLRERIRVLGARLETSERAQAQLQQKLDALAEIERSLPARPDPDAALPIDPAEPDTASQPEPETGPARAQGSE